MTRKPDVSLRYCLRLRRERQVELFQKAGEPAISVESLKERLNRQQIHEVCFVVDCFIQALEREIEISHSDGSEAFCQRSDVLPTRELTKSPDRFFGPR
jgi:hypothetical protein